MTNVEHAIIVEKLVKHYGAIRAVDGLSFSVRTGEIFAMLGPNGAGKTTTVETIEGYRKADSGRVTVLGLDPVRDGHAVKQRIGLMLQQTSIYEKIKVGEAVRMFASFYPSPRDPAELIAQVGLTAHADSFFTNLSGGQKQRLSLALALVGNPRLVFLDEPTASMDPQARLQTWEVIRSLQADGVTVMLTTHYMEEAQRLANRVAIVDHGRLVALGTPAELIGDASNTVLTFTAAPGIEPSRWLPAFTAVHESSPGVYSIATDDPLDAAARLNQWRAATGVQIDDVRITGATLEDIFLKLTGSEVRD